MSEGLDKGGGDMTADRKLKIAYAIRAYLDGDDLAPTVEAAPLEDIDAVAAAFDELSTDRAFVEKVAFAIRMFNRGESMAEAARRCYISYATAKRWKRQLLELTDRRLP